MKNAFYFFFRVKHTYKTLDIWKTMFNVTSSPGWFHNYRQACVQELLAVLPWCMLKHSVISTYVAGWESDSTEGPLWNKFQGFPSHKVHHSSPRCETRHAKLHRLVCCEQALAWAKFPSNRVTSWVSTKSRC